MSSLPQRKKSAEEIAKLRENLGIVPPPGQTAESTTPGRVPKRLVPSTHEAALEHPQPPPVHLDPEPANVALAHPHESHSLKHSERIPARPAPDTERMPAPAAPESPAELRSPKRVRSLRKSEQGPISPPKPVVSQADSLVPFHRHNQEELAEIRRRAALAQLSTPPPPNLTRAHPVWITLGYLAATAAAVGIWFYQVPINVSASCLGVAIVIAALIYQRNPYSRHHAGFITIAALFVAAFGALHYFPQLTFKHGP